MDTLIGFSRPASFNTNWDHTYVECDNGHVWECFGSKTGGMQACSATGDAIFAECLSHPRFLHFGGRVTIPGISQYAGITYATSGVCHQAANRILFPAGLIVASVRGYGWSSFLYSTWGTEGMPWPRLSQCATVHGRVGLASTAPPGTGQVVTLSDTRVGKFFRQLRNIYAHAPLVDTAADLDPQTVRQELHALFEFALGEPYDLRKFDEVAKLQQALRESQRLLSSRLQTRQIGTIEYTLALRRALTNTAARCREILGPGDFAKVFGIGSDDAADLVDPPLPHHR